MGKTWWQSKIKPKIITSYKKLMGGIDSSDMMPYSCLDERTDSALFEKSSFQHHSQDGVE
jgi:hypothetical protein